MDIKCPHCETEYEVEKKDFGKYVTCESCGKGFVVGTTTRGKSNGYSGSYPGSQQKPQYEREAGQQHASGGGNKALIAIIVILLVITSSAVTYIFWERKRNWTTRGFVSNQSTGPIDNNDKSNIERENKRKVELYHSAIYKLQRGYALTDDEAFIVQKVADLEARYEQAAARQNAGFQLSASELSAIGGWMNWKAAEDPGSHYKALNDLFTRETGLKMSTVPLLSH